MNSRTQTLFPSNLPHDVMQGSTLSADLGLGSELVHYYRDATSVPFGHFMLDLSPRSGDRLRYCTNIGSIYSKFYISDPPKQSEFLEDEHTKSLHSPSAPIIFQRMPKPFPSVLSKRVHQVPLQMVSESSQRKLAKHKKRHHITKIHKDFRLFLLETAKKGTCWHVKKGCNSKKSLLLPSLTFCLDMEQFFPFLASLYNNNKSLNTQIVTKQELPKYQAEQNPKYQIDSLKKKINKKLFAEADFLVGKILSCPRIKLSHSRRL